MSVKMLGDAIARYHKILESPSFRDLGWVEALQKKMQENHLVTAGRPITPFLRPHFITRKQYDHLVKVSEALLSAIDRVKRLALANPVLLNRMALLPAEKMLAQIDPGYPFLAVTSLLDTHIHNGTLQFVEYTAEAPGGVAYGESLANVFYDAAPVKEFRKRYGLARAGNTKPLLAALLKSWKEFGGKTKPGIAILDFRGPFATNDPAEDILLAELFRQQGYACEIVSPDQLEYRNSVLRRGDFAIDLVFRRMRLQEFLVRFDLTHPLVRAYRERRVCMVNNFRSEVAQKKAIFELLTDDTITAKFPAAERKAIEESIPWTRVVSATRTNYHSKKIDLPEFVLRNRGKLLLKPNSDSSDMPSFRGWELEEHTWDRAVRLALRGGYVVQERVAATPALFPMQSWGKLELREMNVEVQPHLFLGKASGCSSWLTSSDAGYSSVSGPTATFIIENK